LSGDERAQLALKSDEGGVLVENVAGDSPAAAAGIRPGDVILKARGRQVARPQDVAEVLESLRDDDRSAMLLLVRRNDQNRFVGVKLGDE